MLILNFSNLEGSPENLELGIEVEYSLGRLNGSGGGCASAEYVRVLARGTIPIAKPLEPTLNGTVTRTLRALNPDQAQYSGKQILVLKSGKPTKNYSCIYNPSRGKKA